MRVAQFYAHYTTTRAEVQKIKYGLCNGTGPNTALVAVRPEGIQFFKLLHTKVFSAYILFGALTRSVPLMVNTFSLITWNVMSVRFYYTLLQTRTISIPL